MPERIHLRHKASAQPVSAPTVYAMPAVAPQSAGIGHGHRFDQIALRSDAGAASMATEADPTADSDSLIEMRGVMMPTMRIQRRPAQNAARMAVAPALTPYLCIQREFETEEPVSNPDTASDPARTERLNALSQLVDATAQENLNRRAELDALQESGPDRERLEEELNAGRQTLLDLLEERVTLLEEEIASLNTRIGPAPTSSAEHPEMSDLGNELRDREQELARVRQQLEPLRRWQMHRRIGELNDQIAAVDAELATLPQTCDTNDPTSMLLFERREELVRERDELAARMTGAAHEYEQFDPRWGTRRYGNSPECTNLAEAGCGPTSLAIVLNYLYAEDPESLASSGQIEIVTPPQTADYAATHGRVCNNGTAGDTMVTNVHTGFPGFSGRRITIDQAVDQLRSGNLVIFLCNDCTGQNRSGGNKSYGGHYMVLNGVNADGSSFNVLDPGSNEARDILTITRENLASHNNGFWMIERI